MMTLDEIAAAEARAKAATEGPWHWAMTDDKEPSILLGQSFCCYNTDKEIPAGKVELYEFDPQCGSFVDTHEFDFLIAVCDDESGTGSDFDFIAHARTDVPRLAATARTAIDLLQRLKGRVAINCAEVKDVDAFLAAVAQKGGA